MALLIWDNTPIILVKTPARIKRTNVIILPLKNHHQVISLPYHMNLIF